ncbi:MAG: transposase [Streptosporangiaceae bacterium]
MSSSVSALQGSPDPAADGVIDPAARPVRRSFTAEYRARVVAEYQAAPHGQKAAVLRREGLYQSQIREWAAARDALGRGAPAPRRPLRTRAASGGKDDPGRLRAENQRLRRELARSQAVVEIMGKLQGLLETISEGTGTPPPPATR